MSWNRKMLRRLVMERYGAQLRRDRKPGHRTAPIARVIKALFGKVRKG